MGSPDSKEWEAFNQLPEDAQHYLRFFSPSSWRPTRIIALMEKLRLPLKFTLHVLKEVDANDCEQRYSPEHPQSLTNLKASRH